MIDPAGENLPATQLSHCVAAEVVVANRPAKQSEQVEPGVGLYLPLEQSVQEIEPISCVEDCPSAQLSHLVAAEFVLAFVPAPHGVHSLARYPLILPASQGLHAVEPALE